MVLTVLGSAAMKALVSKGRKRRILTRPTFSPCFDHQVNGFFGNIGAGTHEDDDALGVGRTVVVEQAIGAAGLLGEAIHDGLHDAGNRIVEGRAGFARLEEDVGVLRGAAKNRAVGGESVLAEIDKELVIDHGAENVVGEGQNLGDFMRSAEAIEEMNERNARLERGDLRNQGEVVNFLD